MTGWKIDNPKHIRNDVDDGDMELDMLEESQEERDFVEWLVAVE